MNARGRQFVILVVFVVVTQLVHVVGAPAVEQPRRRDAAAVRRAGIDAVKGQSTRDGYRVGGVRRITVA